MSKGDKIAYANALPCAEGLVETLQPYCERILIAGSLRRQKSEVGDIELVVIPKIEPITDMFGESIGGQGRSLLEKALADLGIAFDKNGAKFKQFAWGGMPIDLFIASPDTWACIATIRTGSADFTHWLVTPRRSGGGCPSHLHFKDGRLMNGGQPITVPDERDLFAALDQRWIAPVDRTEGRWAAKIWS